MTQVSNGNTTPLLEVRNLHASIDDTPILQGIDLTVNLGEVHAIMGPNGSGKSTLANILAGRPEYTITDGEVIYKGQNLLGMAPEMRAREGIFLAFQYPMELPGVRTWQFLKASVDAIRKHRGEKDLSVREFDRILEEKRQLVEMNADLVRRSVNEGFSGGEKKRNEIMQLALLDPTLALLDETDSGLDIDALRIVANGVNQVRDEENAIVLVTHYQRILNYITPDFVHVLVKGRIARSGGSELAHELEDKGYDWIINESVEATAN
jgi:Fe-S cluster assembly ATP-binding protein